MRDSHVLKPDLNPPGSGGSAAVPMPTPRRKLLLLSLVSLGVVYGDIGTSPLYALRECFASEHSVPVTPANVLGVLSLIVWSLLLVISLKYLVLILRADNRGEGGILALASLVREGAPTTRWLFWMGLFGAALLYADGMITPAVTVLGAIEGLHVVTPFFDPYVELIAVFVLIGIFLFQSQGTAAVGKVFGPVTVLWFLVLAMLGIVGIMRAPVVLAAVNPSHGVHFFLENGRAGFLVLGAVFLVVTGGEALYADIGHFGTAPIRLTWFAVVLPGLLLNYFGQGALLLAEPAAAANPFFRLAPVWALIPLVLLATAAAVIASQALISGAFSLTMQAIQLGYIPRLRVAYTSASAMGQIYVPFVNWALLAACSGLVLGFKSSSNLASAYGVAITMTMLITTVLFYQVVRRRWHWPVALVLPLGAFFLAIDLTFFGANMLKIAHGGWFPLLVGGLILFLMLTWRKGRKALSGRVQEMTLPVELFCEDLSRRKYQRVKGTAVFMSGNRAGTPLSLLHNLKHNKVLHEQIILLNVMTQEQPFLPAGTERVAIEALGHGVWRAQVRYGFMEKPDVPAALAGIDHPRLKLKPMSTTYFVGRETILSTKDPALPRWRGAIFAWMTRNAGDVTSYFRLPPNSVVELGARVEV